MSYPGNESLGQDIQTRILDTFQQTLKLAEGDSLKEAKLGCDFILRLDPMFEPARWLQDRIDAADGKIVLDDLRQAVAYAGGDAVAANGDEPAAEPVAEPATATAPPPAPEPAVEPAAAPEAEATPASASPEATASPAADAAPAAPEPSPETQAPAEPQEASEVAAPPIEEAAAETVPGPEAAAEPEIPPRPAVAADDSGTDEDADGDMPDSLEDLVEDSPAAADEASEEPAQTQAAAFADDNEPVPASAEEVASAPVAALDTESERRIQDLLAEGQSAFDQGEYQTAIDAWSRIFLIDIDHPEANERIEAARKLKAEAERTVEEAYHEALGKIESGVVDEGRAGLESVLEMQPDHLAAREQLERLDSGAAPAAEPPAAEPEAQEEELAEADPELADALSEIDADLDLDQPATPADIEGQAAPIPIPKPQKKAKKKADVGDKKKILLYVGAGLTVLVLVAGWLVVSNWSSIFPNTPEAAVQPGDRPSPIERAEQLHAEGQTSTAIAQLKRLPPQHELYSEAQALVMQWEAEAAAAAADAAGPTEAEMEEYTSLMALAEGAQARREFLVVDEFLSRAAAIRPLDEAGVSLKTTADAELEPLRSLIAVFEQGEWERVLRDLWLLREDMPENADVNRLMVDSYYNLGVRALQRGDTATAVDHFAEATRLSGFDPELERASKFAQTYRERPEDLLYRIYVKYLPFR